MTARSLGRRADRPIGAVSNQNASGCRQEIVGKKRPLLRRPNYIGPTQQGPLWCVLGGVLLFRVRVGAVPLALGFLASGFGMGPGVSSPL